MSSKQVKLNADGTYTPPWGGKFWIKKITGRVTSCDIDKVSRYSSSSNTVETKTTYYGGGLLSTTTNILPNTTSHAYRSSSFSIEDMKGKLHYFTIMDRYLGLKMEIGDLVTVIKSDFVQYPEATNENKNEIFTMQLKLIKNHTTDKEWVNTTGCNGRFFLSAKNILGNVIGIIAVLGIIVMLFPGLFIGLLSHSWALFNLGLFLFLTPMILAYLIDIYCTVVERKKANILLPYLATLALSNDGKVSESDLSAAYDSGKYFVRKLKSKSVAATLALFTGIFGGHKFYLGYKKQGIIMLLASVVGILLLFIPSIIVFIISIIESILYGTKSEEDFTETYVTGKRHWF